MITKAFEREQGDLFAVFPINWRQWPWRIRCEDIEDIIEDTELAFPLFRDPSIDGWEELDDETQAEES
jgi:hypothetical protein